MDHPVPPKKRLRIHLIGICGTGMGSLAGLMREAGYDVRGSDESVYPPMSTLLHEKRIPVLEGYRPEHLDDRPDLVVVGNIATRTNPEAVAAADRGIPTLSMPQAVARLFLDGRHSMVVAGTHGKTTTAALLGWVLTAGRRDPSFLVGGVLRNFGSSYRLGRGSEFVIEGDEYETAFFDKGSKFLHYRPRTAIVTSIEYDHAEMFPDLASILETFERFVALVPADGLLLYCRDDPNVRAVAHKCRGRAVSYGLDAGSDWRGTARSCDPEGMEIEVWQGDRRFGLFRSPLSGPHNLRNLVAVVAAAHARGLDTATIETGLRSFSGIKRRQEPVGTAGGILVLDDFAHHPTAVRCTLEGIRAQYGRRRIWAVFEPRTNTTRRSVFQELYAGSFDAADRVIIAAVDHPERAPEGQRFSVERLVADLAARGKDAVHIPRVPDIVAHLAREARPSDVVLVMSNGAFGGIHQKLLTVLRERGEGAAAPQFPSKV